jgi:hypothetical protein
MEDRPPVFGGESCYGGLELFFDDLLRAPHFSLRERFTYAENNTEPGIECRPGLLCNNRRRFSEESATFGMTCPVFQKDQRPLRRSGAKATDQG